MLEVLAVPDKPSYLPGDIIGITLTITNTTGESLTLNNYPYTVEISHGTVVKTFELGSQPDHLTPGETRTYTLEWNQSDNEGTPVNPAVYRIALLYISITQDSSGIQHGEGYGETGAIIINYPQGAMQKTISVNQSRTVDGVTLTLNRVELTDTEMKVYMEKTPVPPYTVFEPPDWRGRADILVTYRFDDGNIFETDIFGYLVLENSVAYSWDYMLYPAPSDAQTLFFTVNSLSLPEAGVYGPFEFEVQLQ